MARYVSFMQPADGDPDMEVPATVLRTIAQALAGPGQDGVFSPAAPLVTHRAAGANYSVDVAPFGGIIAGDDTAGQGSYWVTSDAVENVTVPDPPLAGTRTHRLVVQVRDNRANPAWGTGIYDWIPLLVPDTGGGIPALPASAMDLAKVSVAAGQPNVADSHITVTYPVLRSLYAATAPGGDGGGSPDVGPWLSNQASAGAWNLTGSWQAYTAGQWPPLTFTVPASGQVFVTVTARINTYDIAAVGWRISGTDTVAFDARPDHALFCRAVGAMGLAGTANDSLRVLITGLTPGGTDIVTPGWMAVNTGSTDEGAGQLLVEAV